MANKLGLYLLGQLANAANYAGSGDGTSSADGSGFKIRDFNSTAPNRTTNASELFTKRSVQSLTSLAVNERTTRRRLINNPGCDWFPDANCNLACCRDHDICYSAHHCTAASWLRNICEGLPIAISLNLGGLGTLSCLASLLFDISGACAQCNQKVASCIVRACTGIDDPETSNRCYDSQCDEVFDCGQDCTLLSDPKTCCECPREPGCVSPPTCPNGWCEPEETGDTCLADCMYDAPCLSSSARQLEGQEEGQSLESRLLTGDIQSQEIFCGGACVDPSSSESNCGACDISCSADSTCLSASCSAPGNISWTYSTLNLVPDVPGGWTVSNWGKTIRFTVQDSSNCDGPNDLVQEGFAEGTITVTEGSTLQIRVMGIAELEATNYELLSVSLNHEEILRASSAGGSLQCQMGAVISQNLIPPPYILTPGENRLSVSFSTADPLFHVGCYYELHFGFGPAGKVFFVRQCMHFLMMTLVRAHPQRVMMYWGNKDNYLKQKTKWWWSTSNCILSWNAFLFRLWRSPRSRS